MGAGHAEVRRSRRLVLSFISTVVNYEYAFYWYFYQVILCVNECILYALYWYFYQVTLRIALCILLTNMSSTGTSTR